MLKVLVVLTFPLLVLGSPNKEVKKPVTDKKPQAATQAKYPQVVIETDFGNITVELYPDSAPKTVENFLKLEEKKFYDGLTFHRVEPGFVIQGGDPKGDGTGNAGYSIPAEFNGRKHLEGTVAMARANDPNSASCQFYICLAPQPKLDTLGYTVFGQVISGMDVVKKINQVPVTWTGAFNRPVKPVYMKRVSLKKSVSPPK